MVFFPVDLFLTLSAKTSFIVHVFTTNARCSKMKTHPQWVCSYLKPTTVKEVPQVVYRGHYPSQEGRKCLVTTEQFVSSSKTTTECMQARNRCCCFDLCRQTGSPNTNPNFLNFFRYYLLVNITTYVAAFDKKLNITPLYFITKCLVLASLQGPLPTFPSLAVLQGLG